MFWLEDVKRMELPTQKELILPRDVYEEAVIMSVMINDHDAYARAFSQLIPYYTDRRLQYLGATYRQYGIIRFNLLKLLLQNKFSEFHSAVELLVDSAGEINHEWLMLPYGFDPNKYLRVFTATEIVNFLLAEEAVRDEISGCGMDPSNTYSEMLLLLAEKKLPEYVKKYRPEWKILKGGGVDLAGRKRKKSGSCMRMLLVNQTIRYLMEMDEPENWYW